jgi:hypothetical protein
MSSHGGLWELVRNISTLQVGELIYAREQYYYALYHDIELSADQWEQSRMALT